MKYFRWRGQLRVDAPGGAYQVRVQPRAQLSVPVDVHAKLSKIASMRDRTMRDTLEMLLADVRGVA